MRLRCLVGFVLLAGCARTCPRADDGWPKLHAREVDGGESLAPRTWVTIAAATPIGEEHPATPVVEVPVVPVDKAAAASAPTTTADPEEIDLDDIVIEVNESP